MQIAFVISLVFAIFIALFAVMNSDTVTIRLLWKQFQFSQAIVILGSATIGALMLFIIGTVKDIKKNLKIRELNKKIKELEKRLVVYEPVETESPEAEKIEVVDNKNEAMESSTETKIEEQVVSLEKDESDKKE